MHLISQLLQISQMKATNTQSMSSINNYYAFTITIIYVGMVSMVYLCRLDAQNVTVPINLATGQLNQQELITSALSTEKVSYREEVELKKNYTDMETIAIEQQVVPVSHPLPKIHEQMTSISTEQNTTMFVHSTTHDLVNTIATDTLVKCPQPSKLKKVPSYEEIQMTESQKEILQVDEPKYDDILGATEVKQQTVSVPADGDPRYYILCDPNEPDEEGHSQQPTIRSGNVLGEAKMQLTRTAQSHEHFYEEVADTVSAEQTENTSQGRYNVLATAMDNQDAVVQEDTTEHLNDEKYYSTTRVHRLVPVGKPIERLTNKDNLYQILDSQKPHWEYDQVQLQHNTATSACNFERSTDNLSRSHSTTGRSFEKLDPMYDEPFKPQRSSSLSKVDIYDMDCLFDDPKYGTKRSAIKRSTDQLFDEPGYTTHTEAKELSKRHVSFTAQYESLQGKKCSSRAAALRKTK